MSPGTNGSADQSGDVSELKRRPSSGLNPINSYNGLSNDGLYLTWPQGTPYGEPAEGAAHPPHHHHYETSSLYTPPTLGM